MFGPARAAALVQNPVLVDKRVADPALAAKGSDVKLLKHIGKSKTTGNGRTLYSSKPPLRRWDRPDFTNDINGLNSLRIRRREPLLLHADPVSGSEGQPIETNGKARSHR